jgi:hypothetical protein
MKSTWAGSPWLAVLLLAFACSAPTQTPPKDAATDLGGTAWLEAATTR